jgi:glyoxylase-like metal-dependent hydrolase (beta-lactamase superfamily II)
VQAGLPYGAVIEQIGDLHVVPVFDGYLRESPAQFYVTEIDDADQRGVRTEDWEGYTEFLDDSGKIEYGVGGFLVSTGDHLALIDTGVGPEPLGPFGPYDRVLPGGELPQRLAEVGVDPTDITDVVITHLHPDHTGWATADGGSFFPNAIVRCHRLDWEFFVERPAVPEVDFSPLLLPLVNRLECWEHDGPVLPGIDARHAPGHTPGSTVLILSSGSARAVLLGDAVHCPVELVEPEWGTVGDVDPDLARRTKETLARELEDADTHVVGAHFPGMRFGRLLRGEARRQWVV